MRCADDFIIGFQHESDARRFLDEIRERLEEFAVSLHPDKTCLIEFVAGRTGPTRNAWAWQTGNLQVPEVYVHLW